MEPDAAIILHADRRQFQWGEITVGLVKTSQLFVTAFVFATLFGLAIALLRLSGLVVGGAVTVMFPEFVRNMPLLLLLYLFYHVLGPVFLGPVFDSDRYTASVKCLAVFHAALISEIFRAASTQSQRDSGKAQLQSA